MALASSRKQVYSVVSFTQAKGGLAVNAPRPASGEDSAKRLAERLAGQLAGAVAIYRTGDPDIGEFDDPVEIARYGRVPSEFDTMLLGF